MTFSKAIFGSNDCLEVLPITKTSDILAWKITDKLDEEVEVEISLLSVEEVFLVAGVVELAVVELAGVELAVVDDVVVDKTELIVDILAVKSKN